jgi:hypothetical protein
LTETKDNGEITYEGAEEQLLQVRGNERIELDLDHSQDNRTHIVIRLSIQFLFPFSFCGFLFLGWNRLPRQVKWHITFLIDFRFFLHPSVAAAVTLVGFLVVPLLVCFAFAFSFFVFFSDENEEEKEKKKKKREDDCGAVESEDNRRQQQPKKMTSPAS